MTIKATVAKLKELAERALPHRLAMLLHVDAGDMLEIIAHTESQDADIAHLHSRLTLFVTGECTCPPCHSGVRHSSRTDGAQHYPGCPMIAKERIEALEAECARLKVEPKWMPLMDTPLAINFEALSERQAQNNHGQTLYRLQSRGGLSCCEALAIAQERAWRKADGVAAFTALSKLPTPATAPLVGEGGKCVCTVGDMFLTCGKTFSGAMNGHDCDNLMPDRTRCSHSKACHQSEGEKL